MKDITRIKKLEKLGVKLLELIGDDPTRSGVVETPKRWAKAWLEMTTGLREDPPELKMFESDNDEMVVVKDIVYYSICEHHLIPFFGKVHVGYVANGKVVGLSKIARIVKHFSARPHIQEELTTQIADYLYERINPRGLIVVIDGQHLCMKVRGVRTPEAKAITSAIKGDIDKKEFFDILKIK